MTVFSSTAETVVIGGGGSPRCSVCGGRGPLIDGRCLPHLHVTTEAALATVSAEDVLAYDAEERARA